MPIVCFSLPIDLYSAEMEILAFYAIAIEPIKLQTHSESQNDRLNLSFVDGGKVARNGRKTAI